MVVNTVLASAIVDIRANTIGTTTFILVIGDGVDGDEFIVFVEHNIIDDAFDDDDDDAFDDDDNLKLEDLRVPLLLDNDDDILL